jgi:chromosome segregation ATPase
VRLDDPDHAAPTRADLELRLRALEEKRDRLLARIATQRLEAVDRPERNASEAAPAAILQTLDGTLKAVKPMLGMMTSAREMLLAERADADLRNDTAGATEATKLLEELSERFDELRATIAQLNAAADTVRTSMNTEATNDSKPNEAG